MAVFLNEAQAGCDKELLGFPHLLLCLGVVLQTEAWLYGYHFDAPSQTAANTVAFANFFRDRGGIGTNGVRLYGAGNWTSRYDGRKQGWMAEMRGIAGALGYHGPVCGFDTSIIAPEHGTYVEYRREFGADRCRIFYKRNEKMDYTDTSYMGASALPSRNIASFSYDQFTSQMVPAPGSIKVTDRASLQITPSNEGQLHEVNYFLRLVSFTV